jgi:hypothetical protein
MRSCTGAAGSPCVRGAQPAWAIAAYSLCPVNELVPVTNTLDAVRADRDGGGPAPAPAAMMGSRRVTCADAAECGRQDTGRCAVFQPVPLAGVSFGGA